MLQFNDYMTKLLKISAVAFLQQIYIFMGYSRLMMLYSNADTIDQFICHLATMQLSENGNKAAYVYWFILITGSNLIINI